MKNYTITVNGVPYNVTVEEGAGTGIQQPTAMQAAAPAPAPVAVAAPAPVAAPVAVPVAPAPTKEKSAPTGEGKSIEAPMPGNIFEVNVEVGDVVAVGQTLIVLEAMKMENDIVSPFAGTIIEVNVDRGSVVNAGEVLVIIG